MIFWHYLCRISLTHLRIISSVLADVQLSTVGFWKRELRSTSLTSDAAPVVTKLTPKGIINDACESPYGLYINAIAPREHGRIMLVRHFDSSNVAVEEVFQFNGGHHPRCLSYNQKRDRLASGTKGLLQLLT
jgi:hypothetical protein